MITRFIHNCREVCLNIMADPLQRNLYVGFFVSLICGSVVVFSQIIPEFLIYFLTGTAEEVANSKVLTRQELKCEILLLVSLNVSFLIILSS